MCWASAQKSFVSTREYCGAILLFFSNFVLFFDKKSTCILLTEIIKKNWIKSLMIGYCCSIYLLSIKTASLFCLGYALSSNHVETSRTIKRIEKQMKTPWILSITIADPILMDAFPELYIHYRILTYINTCN